jgi:hypothetical protein
MVYGPIINKKFDPIKIELQNGEVWFSCILKKIAFLRYFRRKAYESPEHLFESLKLAAKSPAGYNYQYYLTFKTL